MTFTLKIAGIPIQVEHRYSYIRQLCDDYLTDESPFFSIVISDEQIEAEMKRTKGRFSKECCENNCLYLKVINNLLKYKIILMHSAVIAVDGIAYVFMAKSGVGKSTHIRLWQEVFGDRAVVVNGDKPMFSFESDTFMAHGSPWRGKEMLGAPISMPVGGICLLERGEVNSIAPASESDVVDKIFHQVLLPTNTEDLAIFMGIMNRILKEVPFYKLKCNMDKEAALVAYEGMRKDKET